MAWELGQQLLWSMLAPYRNGQPTYNWRGFQQAQQAPNDLAWTRGTPLDGVPENYWQDFWANLQAQYPYAALGQQAQAQQAQTALGQQQLGLDREKWVQSLKDAQDQLKLQRDALAMQYGQNTADNWWKQANWSLQAQAQKYQQQFELAKSLQDQANWQSAFQAQQGQQGTANEQWAKQFGEGARQFDVNQGNWLKQFDTNQNNWLQQFAEQQRQFNTGQGNWAQQFGEGQRQFNVGQDNWLKQFAADQAAKQWAQQFQQGQFDWQKQDSEANRNAQMELGAMSAFNRRFAPNRAAM